MLFKIGNKDYTRKIIHGTYAVNQYDIYKEWTDANYMTHRSTTRLKLSGSFTMYFGNQSAFQEFIADLEAVRGNDRSVEVGLMCNNTHEWRASVNIFIDFRPARQQKVLGEAWYPEVNISIQER